MSTGYSRCARPRTPRMMSLSCGEGHSNRRPWTVRQVTSTRAPPSGMKRRWRLMPINSRKTEGDSFTRLQTSFACPAGEHTFPSASATPGCTPRRYRTTGPAAAPRPSPVAQERLSVERERSPVEPTSVPAHGKAFREGPPVEPEGPPVEPERLPGEPESLPAEEESLPLEEESLPVEPERLPGEPERLPAEEESLPLEEEAFRSGRR